MASPYKIKKIEPAVPVAAPVTTATQTPVKPPRVSQNVINKVSTATATLQPPTTSVKPPTVTPQEKALQPFGGQDAYIKSQMDRFSGGNATLQGNINKDLQRFGVKASPITGRPEQPGFNATSLAGATIGNDNGQSFFTLPDGSREWIDTPEEQGIADQINAYNVTQQQLEAAQAAGLAQNQSDFNFANAQLGQGEAVDKDYAQQLQNRRGGFYSGGLDYQTGGITRDYAQQRGQLSQQFQAANQALLSKYGSETEGIRNNINNLLSTAPGLIQQSIAQAAQAKADAAQKQKQANLDAALNFTNETGYLVNPQDDYSGFYRQVEQGAGYTPKQQLEFDKLTESQQKNQIDSLWKVADNTGRIPDALADIYGIERGTQTRAARQWADSFGLQQDNNDLAWIREERLGTEGGGKEKTPESISPSVAGDYLSNLVTEDFYDIDQDKTVQRKITDKDAREDAFTDMYNTFYLDTGISGTKLTEVLARAGYSKDEIARYKKDYPQAFQQASAASGGSTSVDVPQEFQNVIATAQKKYGLGGSNLLAKIAQTESSWNPNAHNSGSGASGLFQFIPSTAKGYNIDPYNVEQAADAAGKLITGLLAKYKGDVSKALAGYNAGGGKVDRLIKQYGDNWLAHAPQETQGYIKKILG